ncbi:MAG: hypothetical protein JSW39_25235, partial [Desulfobacterales bacterium]
MKTYSIIPIVLCTIVLSLGRPTTIFAQFCDPLPPPAGNIIHVDPSQTGELTSIVAGASQGDTIFLADGIYPL